MLKDKNADVEKVEELIASRDTTKMGRGFIGRHMMRDFCLVGLLNLD